MVTYNCTGLYADRTAFIQDFLKREDVDILFLQETWLHEWQFNEVMAISKQYLAKSVSGILNEDIIVSKRGYGGVTTLWKKTFAHRVKPLESNSRRLTCVSIQLNENYKMLVINTYLPNDNYHNTQVSQEFDDEVENIVQLCIKYSDFNSVLLVGDMNIDLNRNNAHSKRMCEIAERFNITFTKSHDNAKYEHTYENPGAGHQSSIDHFIVPNELYHCIDTVECLNNSLNPSFHKPLKITFNSGIDSIIVTSKSMQKDAISWQKVREQEIEQYKQCVNHKLEMLTLPQDAIMCENVNCMNPNHKDSLSRCC